MLTNLTISAKPVGMGKRQIYREQRRQNEQAQREPYSVVSELHINGPFQRFNGHLLSIALVHWRVLQRTENC